MTNQQINIAIAKAGGWQYEFNEDHEDPKWYWIPPNDPDGDGEPPDYCNDLNSMHEAEKTLTKEQVRVYSDFLADSPHESCWASCTIWHQTSRQRAEAFLKTLGKWEE
jgi:hypothetical protein